MQHLVINSAFHLSPLRSTDVTQMTRLLQHKEISDSTLNIPWPYTNADAEWFIHDNIDFEQEFGHPRVWAIRDSTERLLGVIGLHYTGEGDSDTCEFGYWLGKEFWNRGITAAAIKRFCEWARTVLLLRELTAHAFENNIASQRCLLKNDFTRHNEEVKIYLREGTAIRGIRFAKTL